MALHESKYSSVGLLFGAYGTVDEPCFVWLVSVHLFIVTVPNTVPQHRAGGFQERDPEPNSDPLPQKTFFAPYHKGPWIFNPGRWGVRSIEPGGWGNGLYWQGPSFPFGAKGGAQKIL